jgi:hypothetical protein
MAAGRSQRRATNRALLTRLATQGTLSTNVYVGLLPGAEHGIYWQPPLYFIVLAAWLRGLALSLATVRSFSLLWAVVSVVFVYLREAEYRIASSHGGGKPFTPSRLG